MSNGVIIVGGGAAGLATAIFARRNSPSTPVTILDGARTLGAKILVSGGGRCNVTNAVVTERDFWGGRSTIVRQILKAFPVSETVRFFRDIGVPLHEETGGKLFPDSNRARDVLEALLAEAHRAGAQILTGYRVVSVERLGDRFQVDTSMGPLTADAVVLATGGRSLPKSGSDGSGYAIAQRLGHTIVEPTPALVPLVFARGEADHDTLSGVSHEVDLTVWVDGRASITLRGSLLWTHFGISGPVALNASRHWARARLERRDVRMTMNLLPGLRLDTLDAQLIAAAKERPRASTASVLAAWLPASVGAAFAARIGAADLPLSQVPREERRRLACSLVEWPVPIADTRGYTFAEVTAGGVPLTEITPQTMASRIMPALFLVGEILDVDGRIGGFNFQWAWSSGRVAAAGLRAFANHKGHRSHRDEQTKSE